MTIMNTIEALTLRVREVIADANSQPLRITAPDALIYQFIEEFEARGETPEFGSDLGTGCDVVWLGPHLAVHADNDLPADTFAIVVQK